MKIPVRNLSEHGMISDVTDIELPANAWSSVANGKVDNDKIGKAPGYEVTEASPAVRPEIMIPYLDPDAGGFHWIIPGLDDDGNSHIATWDGTANTVRTRGAETVNNNPPDAGYTRIAGVQWTGGVLNGLAFVNPGGDVPQKWDRTGGTLNPDFEDFANWPSGYTARVMRPYRSFIMAYDVNDGSGRDPYKIVWSDETPDAFSEPGTWVPAPGNRAGDTQVSELGGYLVDSLPMRNTNIVYRQSRVMVQQFISGNNVFRFDPLFDNFGLLSQRCVKSLPGGKHFVVCVGDIRVHDGNTDVSVVNARVRDYIFEQTLDQDNYANSYVVPNYSKDEMWFCYPTTGQVLPNRAAVWNYKSGAWTFRDLSDAAHIGYGFIPGAGSPLWNDTLPSTTFWDDYVGVWDAGVLNPTVSNLLVAQQETTIAASNLLKAEETYTDGDGAVYLSRFQRTGIGSLTMGNRILADEAADKDVRALWLTAAGAPFQVYVGGSEYSQGPYSWSGPYAFNPLTDRKVDVKGINHKYLGVRLEDTGSAEWTASGYAFELANIGGDRG